MKAFLKFIAAIVAVFTAVIGALAVFDKLANRNRIEGDYLECEVPNNSEE